MRTPFAIRSLFTLTVLVSCAEPVPFEAPPDEAPQILEIRAPEPVLDGSEILITGTSLHLLGREPSLVIRGTAGTYELPVLSARGAELLFQVDATLINNFGEGEHEVDLTLEGDGVETPKILYNLAMATAVDVVLDEVPSGNVYRNDVAILQGGGFVSEDEGSSAARFRGTFTADGSDTEVEIDVELKVEPAERFSRERGLVTLSTDLGGPGPGTFEGTIEVTTTLPSGYEYRSGQAETTLEFERPVLYSASPTTFSLEQIVTVRGAGFLGGNDHPDEVTIIRLDGEFDEVAGETRAFHEEVVLSFVAGDEMEAVIESVRIGNRLESRIFEAHAGTFTGTATPVVIKGPIEVEGEPIAFSMTLTGTRQAVYLRFLPSFYDSLTRFGLANATGEIEGLVAERIESIYENWAIDVRLEEPTDYSMNGYTTVEILGTDPNGVGLFGYDNTPGKDIGNVRLYDRIGGANAETQEDNYPGYGGVFIESFLYWSEHPDLPGDPPIGIPAADPLFDQVFDPVRSEPASREEIGGIGTIERIADVRLALESLANIIGETTAHELGHSLGLADPYGASTTFHSVFPDEGCLMDGGGDRPFGERAAFPGFMPSRLCADEPDYLEDILLAR